MPSLSTTFMGLELKNPIIAASSGLTRSVDKIKECEQSGAGAVVLKSIFEEVLARENFGIDESTSYHTEAFDYLRSQLELQYGPRDYIELIREAKDKTDIPIIASINCISDKWWTDYAQQMEEAGADALELNVFKTATDRSENSQSLEAMYYAIVENVKSRIKIPVAIKLGMYFTALPNLAAALADRGADALVLFNRFTEPDINIDELKLTTTFSFSTSRDMLKPLRWTALLSGQIPCDIAATTGIKTGKDAIKLLLAGASALQIAALLYQKGIDSIGDVLQEIESWMAEHSFERISDFKGKLSFRQTDTPDQYLRAQFIEKIKGVE